MLCTDSAYGSDGSAMGITVSITCFLTGKERWQSILRDAVLMYRSPIFISFFRKIMEKQGWNQKLGMEMIHAYQEVRPLGDAEFENFCIRLAYPEKFWKLANHYFNSRKTWIPEKSLQKLEILDMQEKNGENL